MDDICISDKRAQDFHATYALAGRETASNPDRWGPAYWEHGAQVGSSCHECLQLFGEKKEHPFILAREEIFPQCGSNFESLLLHGERVAHVFCSGLT